MTTYGRSEIFRTGGPIRLLAEGFGEWFPVGITVDWSLVAALGAPLKTLDGTSLPTGAKYLRFGQVMTKVTAQSVQTVTLTATGGTFALSGFRPDTGAYVSTGPIAYNASAAAVLAALQDTAVFGTSYGVSVTGTGPYVITGQVGVLTPVTAGLTGGSATIAQTTPVANSGLFGPYDSAASDGRQTLSRGNCCVLDRSVYQLNPFVGFNTYPSDHPAGLTGGMVWRGRLIATSGSHSLAAGPTFAELEAAFPRLEYGPIAP